MNKRRNAFFGIGIASIVVIFVVLCMTIFAVLSLSTANEEHRLAKKYAQSAADYWRADTECTELANLLIDAWHSDDMSAVYDLAAQNGAECTEADIGLYVSYSRPVNDITDLTVTLLLNDTVTVVSWNTTPVGVWIPEDDLPIWGS